MLWLMLVGTSRRWQARTQRATLDREAIFLCPVFHDDAVLSLHVGQLKLGGQIWLWLLLWLRLLLLLLLLREVIRRSLSAAGSGKSRRRIPIFGLPGSWLRVRTLGF